MTDAWTVLLVGGGTPHRVLLEQLKKQNIFAESCTREELPLKLQLAEAALVVNLGHQGATQLLSLLKKSQGSTPSRVVFIAERAQLPRLRKLDRSLVASVLATDMTADVAAARILMLLKKLKQSGGATIPPPSQADLPAPGSARSAQAIGRVSLERRSLGPAAPQQKAAARSQPPFLQPPAPPAPLPAVAVPADPMVTTAPLEQSEIPDQKALATRVLLADSDITRGDMIAGALREAGLTAQLVPLDPAATRWPLIRKFGADLLLADGRSLEEEGRVWHQLFNADSSLSHVQLVALPFKKLFDEASGEVQLGPLVPHLPILAKVPSRNRKSSESFYDRATIHDESELELSEPQRSTSPQDISTQADLRKLAERSAPPERFKFSGATPHPDELAEAAFLDENTKVAPRPSAAAPPFSSDSAPFPPGAAPLSPGAPPRSSSAPAPVVHPATGDRLPQPLPVPARSGSRFRLLGPLLGLAVAGTACWFLFFRGATLGAPETEALAPTSVGSEPSLTAAEVGEKNEPSDDSTATTAPINPFLATPERPAARCEEVVSDLPALRARGVPHAEVAWSKAKRTLVLGDIPQALRLMCEAALVHPQSLALEGLAALYLTLHAPKQAQRWAQKAIAVRPDRRKTQELQGDVYSQLGEPDKAREVWAKALQLDPADKKTLSLVAMQFTRDADLRLRGGDIANAEKFFRRAATLDPESPAAATGLAQVSLKQRKFELAKIWVKRALEVQIDHGEALVILADLTLREGHEKEALGLYKKALRSAPGNSRAHQQVYQLSHK